MKLWAILAVCILLLRSVSNTPLPSSWSTGKKRSSQESLLEDEDSALGMYAANSERPTAVQGQQGIQHNFAAEVPDDYPDQFDDVLEFIQDTIKRLRRSSNRQSLSRRDRGRAATIDSSRKSDSSKKTSKETKKRRNKGCVLREIHLNVTDLGLGYEAKEELKFRYCSGSCNNPETTYDQILKNLTIKKKLVNDKVKQACCRPIAFDDDVSFLDDNLVYHTLRQHSAKKCGCV
ncbi:glial cell line-derived neurotrophic factor [Bufo gargarizans]|uniref:glial cell line-derived neurotrophic factor n=1 Tax=Bufo bufo TaxID=8384 RepID=UPI001ABE8CA7|nr:glial cell line-derived neurotrophic factor [Bufo bufo]XP_044150586.1 glial cell line-derived neurotrophic factor [Bufo gargarizans]